MRTMAEDISEGDYLIDLDNGYVFMEPEEDQYYVDIFFHTSEGDEANIRVPKDFELNVQEGEPV